MITFKTSDPVGLLKAFNAAVALDNSKGGIATWTKLNTAYTHEAPRWARQAYFEPHIVVGALIFNIVKNKGSNISVTVYGTITDT